MFTESYRQPDPSAKEALPAPPPLVRQYGVLGKTSVDVQPALRHYNNVVVSHVKCGNTLSI